MKTNIDEPCAGNLQARFFRGSCSNKTQTRGVKLQLLPNKTLKLTPLAERIPVVDVKPILVLHIKLILSM
ncbi:hypothetical protein [Wolbachia endosymbiont (group A) of Barypeithes pellucidus]|uniref:hypothetical protein n=1 Tax=Wolbachia endosymbiont (group A) of Barypeithes pellucidus TaxID=3139322 RepID=UPI003CCB24A3